MVNNKKNVEELEKQIVQTQAALNAYKQYGLEPEYGIKPGAAMVPRCRMY